MSVLSEWALWYQELQAALTDAVSGPVTDGLKQEIRKQAQKRVYDAYSSTGTRRGQIGAAHNLEASAYYEADGMSLKIQNVTVQQGAPSGKSETQFVESGDPAYRQPFARPFMDEALEEYAKNQGPMDLEAALRARGFTVV